MATLLFFGALGVVKVQVVHPGKKSETIDKHLFEKGRVAIATNRNQKHEVKSFIMRHKPLFRSTIFKYLFAKFCQRHMRGKSRSTWPGMPKEFFLVRNHAFWLKACKQSIVKGANKVPKHNQNLEVGKPMKICGNLARQTLQVSHLDLGI